MTQERLPATAMQTFQVVAPRTTHTVPATCEEVECGMYARGWKMKIDLQTDLGQKQAYYIKHHSGRSYRVESQADGLVTLEFGPNQPCFQEHRKKIDRPEIYRVKGGDSRGNPLGVLTRVHKKPEFWVEEMQETLGRLDEVRKRGW